MVQEAGAGAFQSTASRFGRISVVVEIIGVVDVIGRDRLQPGTQTGAMAATALGPEKNTKNTFNFCRNMFHYG